MHLFLFPLSLFIPIIFNQQVCGVNTIWIPLFLESYDRGRGQLFVLRVLHWQLFVLRVLRWQLLIIVVFGVLRWQLFVLGILHWQLFVLWVLRWQLFVLWFLHWQLFVLRVLLWQLFVLRALHWQLFVLGILCHHQVAPDTSCMKLNNKRKLQGKKCSNCILR